MGKLLRIIFLLLIPGSIYAQKVKGIVTDANGEILPYASVTVKGSSKGTNANSQGYYSLNLSAGQYTLVCQYVNYKKEEKKIQVTGQDIELNFKLEIQQLTLGEVVVKKGEDPAYEIIRKTIKKRPFYNNQVDSFTVNVYIKGLIRSRGMPARLFGKKIEHDKSEGLDSLGKGIVFLSESMTNVSYVKPGKIKYQVISSRVSGDNSGFGLSIPFFINFYDNNVNTFDNLNPRGFISPISDGALSYYKYHYEGSFFEEGKMVNTIKVIPRRKSEPLFSGTIQIVEDDWRIYSLDLKTTKDYSLEMADTVRITQIHGPVGDNVWKTKNQVLYTTVKFMGFDFTGNFVNVYSDYDINPGFAKKHFDRIVMKYDTSFNKKDTNYWNQVRPVTLEPDEKKDFVFKDSIQKAYADSFKSKRVIDSLRRNQKPVTLRNILWTGAFRYFKIGKSNINYSLKPLLTSIQYNTVEGWVAMADQTFRVFGKQSRGLVSLDWNMRYGFSNQHFNSFGALSFRAKKNMLFSNRYFRISGGRRVSQFNHQSPVEPRVNSISTLLYRRNYMKIYENWFGAVEFNTKTESGFKLNVKGSYEDRIPLVNTSDFSVFGKKIFTPNHPYELANIPFNRHQALVIGFTLSFQPGQKYIQFPKYKVSLGSKMPTFELQYYKGIDMLGSDVDFDKWKLSVFDNMNLKLRGEFRYKFSIGGFFNNRKVEIPDFTHFNGNQLWSIHQYLDAFQLAPYYKYSNTEKFFTVARVEHHFNGLLTNKIPLFNRLKWHLVAGANSFYVNDDKYYVEAFLGLENIFKLFRVDFINAYQPGINYKFGFKVGAGGILGGRIKFER